MPNALLFLKVVWVWFKKHWQIGLIIGALVLLGIFKSHSDAAVKAAMDEVAKVDAAHKAELAKINEAHDAENQQHEAALKDLQQKLNDIQTQYDEAKRKLEESKRVEIKKIVEEHYDDPNELAKRLSQATGIPVGDH